MDSKLLKKREIEPYLTVGYVAYNGHVFSKRDADRYNHATDDVNTKIYFNDAEGERFYRDFRRELFSRIVGDNW